MAKNKFRRRGKKLTKLTKPKCARMRGMNFKKKTEKTPKPNRRFK